MRDIDTLAERLGKSENTIRQLQNLVYSIMDALGTSEIGEALIEVARNAHKAEQELAALHRKREDFSVWWDNLPAR